MPSDSNDKPDEAAPVAAFNETALVKPVVRSERPSRRFERRKKRVILPLVGVSALSSVAVGVLYSQRMVDAPLGVLFMLVMPVVISGLLGLLLKKRSKLQTAGVVAAVQLATVVVSIVTGKEGGICLLMASPILFALTYGITLTTQSVVRKSLIKADAKHRAALTAVLVLVLPYLAPHLDRMIYADENDVSTVSSRIDVAASQQDVWRSLEHLDLHFAPSRDPIAALLPVPTAVTGDGARIGAERRVEFENGVVVATVTRLEAPARYDIHLRLEHAGREFFDHWIELQSSRFDIEPVDAQHCVVVHSTTYRPLLYPRILFEPIEHEFGGLIGQRLLDAYAQQAFASPAPLVATADP
ncbi:MAG TPA: hypothetical protein VGO62_19230 [Myxococcota bacterium]